MPRDSGVATMSCLFLEVKFVRLDVARNDIRVIMSIGVRICKTS